jgi:ubiquinol-cytochrome c reductase subunit 9
MPAAAASGLTATIYNTFFKKNSVFVATIFAGALAFEVGFDTASNKIWDNLNKGVSVSIAK